MDGGTLSDDATIAAAQSSLDGLCARRHPGRWVTVAELVEQRTVSPQALVSFLGNS
ncbi:hypothetical protein ACH347_36275 [Saccharopolyspora sp. 5N102]|uniref:hypothetical protein n=1 Tax=Saccharopolyspora sp. 5N102 TaxID=3375155 RepID=UPI003789827B